MVHSTVAKRHLVAYLDATKLRMRTFAHDHLAEARLERSSLDDLDLGPDRSRRRLDAAHGKPRARAVFLA